MGGLSVWLSLPRRGLTIVSHFEARQRRHAILMARHAVLDVSSDRKVAGCTARCSASSLTFPACGLGIRFFLEGRPHVLQTFATSEGLRVPVVYFAANAIFLHVEQHL